MNKFSQITELDPRPPSVLVLVMDSRPGDEKFDTPPFLGRYRFAAGSEGTIAHIPTPVDVLALSKRLECPVSLLMSEPLDVGADDSDTVLSKVCTLDSEIEAQMRLCGIMREEGASAADSGQPEAGPNGSMRVAFVEAYSKLQHMVLQQSHLRAVLDARLQK